MVHRKTSKRHFGGLMKKFQIYLNVQLAVGILFSAYSTSKALPIILEEPLSFSLPMLGFIAYALVWVILWCVWRIAQIIQRNDDLCDRIKE